MARLGLAWMAVTVVLGLLSVAPASAQLAPIAGGVGPDGWTVLKKSPDTQVVYASSSQGDDANDGLSPQRPLKTLEKGMSLLRDGHPDWLLLKRGDVWREGLGGWTNGNYRSGRSAAEPIVIGSYGDAPERPLIKVGTIEKNGFFRSYTGRTMPAGWKGPSNVAIVDMHVYDEKGDPNSPEFDESYRKDGGGLFWHGPGKNLLVENCFFEFNGLGVIGKGPTGAPDGDFFRNFQLRRCSIIRNWTTSGHCQGLFMNRVDGALIEECVLDHNGYCFETGDLPTVFNHDVYVTIECDNVVLRGSIVARGSSTGFYCRTNGILEDNLCLDNTPSLNLGRITKFRPGGVTGRVAGNVVIGAVSVPRGGERVGPGIELANVNMGGAVVENNILIGATGSTAALKIGAAGVGAHNVTLRKNTVYNWSRAVHWVGTEGEKLEKQNLSGIVFEDNLFQLQRPARENDLMLTCRDSTELDGFRFSGNSYWWDTGDRGCVVMMEQEFSLAEWLRKTGEGPGAVERVTFADPARDVGTYHGSLGSEATMEAFLAEAALQSRRNWRPEYTAVAVIEYIREGFRPKDAAN